MDSKETDIFKSYKAYENVDRQGHRPFERLWIIEDDCAMLAYIRDTQFVVLFTILRKFSVLTN